MITTDSSHLVSHQKITALETLKTFGNLPLRAVLTRPADRQVALETQLTSQGWQVLSVPALDLIALGDLPHDMLQVKNYDWIVFVSRSAWQIYYEQIQQLWPTQTGIAVVGQGTANVIRADLYGQRGTPQILVPDSSASQDSEGLWQEFYQHLNSSSRVLIVAGRDGRSWLADRLREHGVSVDVLAVYERQPAVLSEQAIDCLHQWATSQVSGHSGVWLLTSKHSIEAMTAALSMTGLLATLRPAAWVLTHPRLIEPAQRLAAQTAVEYEIPVLQCSPDLVSIKAAFDQIGSVFQSSE